MEIVVLVLEPWDGWRPEGARIMTTAYEQYEKGMPEAAAFHETASSKATPMPAASLYMHALRQVSHEWCMPLRELRKNSTLASRPTVEPSANKPPSGACTGENAGAQLRLPGGLLALGRPTGRFPPCLASPGLTWTPQRLHSSARVLWWRRQQPVSFARQ